MKQISQLSTRQLWCLLIYAFLCAGSAFAQAEAPLAQKGDVWTVNYYVSVTGQFKKEPELGADGPTVYYHIKREYEGKATLVYAPKADDPKAATLYPLFRDPATRVHTKIDDFIHSIWDPACNEYKSVEETWKADVDSVTGDQKSRHAALLLIYNEQLSYKISFPILYVGPKTFDEIEYTRLEFSNPGRKLTQSRVEHLSFATHQYPNVKGYIEKYSIIRAPLWLELKEEGGRFSWLSPILHPDEPLFDGVPESKDKVNILIHYSLIKMRN